MALTNAACSGGPEGAAAAANIVCQIPRLQRAKRLSIVLWRSYAFGQSTQPTSRANFVSYFPFGRKPSWKFALAFSTCMILLKISRSSLRQGPVGLPAKRLDLRPLLIVEPNKCASIGEPPNRLTNLSNQNTVNQVLPLGRTCAAWLRHYSRAGLSSCASSPWRLT
jgi:hypothetical protein